MLLSRFTFRRLVAGLILPVLFLTPAMAWLGESMASIKKRVGRPEAQVRKDAAALWLIEAVDGQLAYTVTFNAKGESIAEGLKPVKRARLTGEMAQEFVEGQLAPFRESKTLFTRQPGEKYVFAGQNYVCGGEEQTWVDDENGLLVVWNRSAPSIMVVSREMVQGK